MPYYVRVLGTEDPDIPISLLIEALKADGQTATIEVDTSEELGPWITIDVSDEQGRLLTRIERNPVTQGSLGAEELNEFKDEVVGYKPSSATDWLIKFFEKVNVIYCFQLLNAAFEGSSFDIISSLQNKLWNQTAGIVQADNEGFSNEDGYHILWQFSDDMEGEWSCAVMNEQGQWEKFIMDLGNSSQRLEFQSGKVPKDAVRVV